MAFDHLFSPLKINHLTLRNRIALPPHSAAFSAGYGTQRDRVADYYVERAKGGVGLIIMSNFVVPQSVLRMGSWGGNLDLSDMGQLDTATQREALPTYRSMIERIHDQGAKFFCQLNLGGRQYFGPAANNYGLPLLAPSPIPCPATRQIPKEMTVEDIQEHVRAYVEGAMNMREAGADGVEIFAAQGYLMHEFLSPASNWRTDAYGGTLENRMRFLEDTIIEIRKAVGRNFVVGVRMNGHDFSKGGIDLPMAEAMAKRLHADGQIDYLNISGMTYLQLPAWIADMTAPPATFSDLSQSIRAKVPGIPVCVVTRIGTPELADRLIADGKADFVGMVRALISDPEFPNKALRGDFDDIRRCTYSNHCINSTMDGRGLSCIHNPAVGKEGQLGIGRMKTAPRARRVIVVGGGPAGMAAARVAKERGHAVTLLESRDALGGQNRMASSMASRKLLSEVTRWQEHQLEKLQIDIRFRHEATAETILAFEPDAIVIATGSRPAKDAYSSMRPQILRIEGTGADNVLTVWDVFDRPQSLGRKVLLVADDPHMTGAYVAEHLSVSGHKVTLVTPQLLPVNDLNLKMVPEVVHRLRAKEVEIHTSLLLDEIVGGVVNFKDRFSDRRETFRGIDTIILSTRNVAENRLVGSLKTSGVEVFAVGDSVAPRRIDDAIVDGERAGWMI